MVITYFYVDISAVPVIHSCKKCERCAPLYVSVIGVLYVVTVPRAREAPSGSGEACLRPET
jgi:hypothetical protein